MERFQIIFYDGKLILVVVELDKTGGITVGPALGDILVVVVGDVGMSDFHGCAVFVRVKLDGHDRWFDLFTEVPLLNDLLSGFELEVLTDDALVPHGKLGARFGLHDGVIAGPELDGGLDSEGEIYVFGRSGNGVVFFKVFQVIASQPSRF